MAEKPILKVLKEKKAEGSPPVWFMRQAGRYLPEYHHVRLKDSFIKTCLTPERATEITLQPLRRFPLLDAAILFSDILMVPYALNQKVWFEEGPKLTPLSLEDIETLFKTFHLATFLEKLEPVFKAVSLIKEALPFQKTLLGFAGAPWTVATYMIEGGSSKNFSLIKEFADKNEQLFKEFLLFLADITADYLIAQIKAGAEAVQIFESWAGVVPGGYFKEWVLDPFQRIVDKVRTAFKDIPIISFPKGGVAFYEDFVKRGATALSIDACLPLERLKPLIINEVPLQGGLDPLFLVAGGKALEKEALRLLHFFKDTPYIFNLSHGILPQTPISHVEQVLRVIKG